MPFSLLDLEKNYTCDVMNLAHLTRLVLLHYLIKVETMKTHLNTNSAFNVNYKNAPNYNDSFIKCSDEPHNAYEQ